MLPPPSKNTHPRNNWLLVIFSFLLFIYIHLPLILRWGYNCDEILDYRGTNIARDTYLAFGRWGIVAWNAIVSDGMKPWSGGVTAGIILSIALLIQTKILFPKEEQIKHRFIYCTLYLASCQFAYMLSFSMLIEGFALSVLFASLACYLFYDCTIRSIYRFPLTAVCLIGALSCYQTSGLVFFALACCKFMTIEQKKHPLKSLFLFAGICLTSLSIFFLIKYLIHTLHLPCNEAIEFTKAHEAYHLNAGILGQDADISELTMNRLGVALQCNIYIILCAIVALGVLILRLIYAGKWVNLCTLAIALAGTLCASLLTAANPGMYFFVPVYTSFIIVYAISDIKWHLHPYVRMCGYALLSIFCIYAAHKVSGMALIERTHHENCLLDKFAQYLEARKLHSNLTGAAAKTAVNIIVFEPDWNIKAPNFYNSYPFQNFKLGTMNDYEKHKEALQVMPSWPATGSIREHKGDIIIKGTNGW